MSKAEILAELTANGNIARFSRTLTWEKAFDLHNKQPGNKQLNMRCSSCYRDVLAWLRS